MGTWGEIMIAGHPCEAYEPSQLAEHAQAVLYLHDCEQTSLRGKPAFTGAFDRYGWRVLCPQTGESWWADRIHRAFDAELTAERYLLDEALPWLSEHWQVAPPQVALLGCEMGGQGALRIAYKHPNLFPIAAAISPALDFQIYLEDRPRRPADAHWALAQMYDEVETGRQDTATLHIHPLNWPRNQWFCADAGDFYWHDSAERLRTKLYSLGVPYEADMESTAAPGWPYYEQMAPAALAFIAERLEQERKRVV